MHNIYITYRTEELISGSALKELSFVPFIGMRISIDELPTGTVKSVEYSESPNRIGDDVYDDLIYVDIS